MPFIERNESGEIVGRFHSSQYEGQEWINDSDLVPLTELSDKSAEIKTQLVALDGKSVRALHEAVLALADTGVSLPEATLTRLRAIEAEKQALRAQLQ